MADQSEYAVNDEQVRNLIGRRVVVALTFVYPNGAVDSVEDFAGVVDRVNLDEGIVLRLASSQERAIPPDLSNLEPASPGDYHLKSTGDVVQDPDYLAAWTVSLPPPAELPRWVQVPAGLLFGAFTLLCLVGSLSMVFGENEKAPVLAPLFGLVMTLACVWILLMCFRLVSGRRRTGGIMSPTALRAVAYFFLLLPIGGLFTGYFVSHPLRGAIQTLAYVAVFLGLRRLAKERSGGET